MRSIYLWARDLHLYVGLVISPLVLVFAASVVLLNHPSTGDDPPPVVEAARTVRIPPSIEKLEGMPRAVAAQQILDQLGVSGEIGWISYDGRRRLLTFPVARPGRQAFVRVSLADNTATVEWSRWRASDAVNWLHKMPGPHLVNIRGNWRFTRIWRPVVDLFAYFLLFVTATGAYLWIFSRAERRAGLAFLGLGAISFVGIIYALL